MDTGEDCISYALLKRRAKTVVFCSTVRRTVRREAKRNCSHAVERDIYIYFLFTTLSSTTNNTTAKNGNPVTFPATAI
jgi:hypothetical protein